MANFTQQVACPDVKFSRDCRGPHCTIDATGSVLQNISAPNDDRDGDEDAYLFMGTRCQRPLDRTCYWEVGVYHTKLEAENYLLVDWFTLAIGSHEVLSTVKSGGFLRGVKSKYLPFMLTLWTDFESKRVTFRSNGNWKSLDSPGYRQRYDPILELGFLWCHTHEYLFVIELEELQVIRRAQLSTKVDLYFACEMNSPEFCSACVDVCLRSGSYIERSDAKVDLINALIAELDDNA